MPLKRKTTCPELVLGTGGTVHVVEKEVIEVPPLSHDAKVCQPSGSASGTGPGLCIPARERPGPNARNGTLIVGGFGKCVTFLVASSILAITPLSWINP